MSSTGTAAAPVTYRAYPGERVCLSGGVLQNRRLATALVSRLAADVVGTIPIEQRGDLPVPHQDVDRREVDDDLPDLG